MLENVIEVGSNTTKCRSETLAKTADVLKQHLQDLVGLTFDVAVEWRGDFAHWPKVELRPTRRMTTPLAYSAQPS